MFSFINGHPEIDSRDRAALVRDYERFRAGLPEGEVAITELATCREKFGSDEQESGDRIQKSGELTLVTVAGCWLLLIRFEELY